MSMHVGVSVDALARARAQEVIFASVPSRAKLLNLPKFPTTRMRRIFVIRNHAIEPMISQMEHYARFGGWQAEWHLSEYDDTFSLREFLSGADDKEISPDVVLFWINPQNYKMPSEQWSKWLVERCVAFRRVSEVPAIVATWGGDATQNSMLAKLLGELPGVFYADINAVCAASKTPFLDARLNSVAGTPLSRTAQMVVAREIACRWLPAVLFEPIKSVMLDLDGTLHRGVLGEDGIDGVELSAGHCALQKFLKELKNKGVLLALISRNEPGDVKELFRRRRDYPLRYEDFTAAAVTWGDKADGISDAAEQMRISPDAVVMVDDNPGELLSIAARLPNVNLLWADEDAKKTVRALAHYPRLWRFACHREDVVRGKDLAMNKTRKKTMAAARNEDDYFQQLKIKLKIAVNARRHLPRLAQLAGKTNQFNLSLRRMNEAQADKMLSAPASDLVAVSLADRLSDSGIIAVIAASRTAAALDVWEVCLSCRALGRKLESAIILGALQRMSNFNKCKTVKFHYTRGPRNAPALSWLQKQTGEVLPDGDGVVVLQAVQIAAAKPNANIAIAEIHE